MKDAKGLISSNQLKTAGENLIMYLEKRVAEIFNTLQVLSLTGYRCNQ